MEEMTMKELYEKVRDNAFDMRRCMSNTTNHAPYIERMKNILFNNLDAIENALKYAADAEKQIKVLELELADAERELDEATKKTTHKKTKATADANE